MEFVTDTVDYSVAQFHDAFNHILPVLAKVQQGFCGDILEDTFDKEQVIRIQAESRQKRVLVNVQMGRGGRKCFSMPLDYHAKFCVVSKRGKAGREAHLEKIINTEKLPVKIQFAKKEEITVGNTRTATLRFPEMELVKSFDEIYLLGNFVTAGIFSVPVVAIPLYLSQLRLAEIVGVKGQSPFAFQQFVQYLSDLVQPIKYDPTFGNKDIAEYRPESVQPDAEDSCIEPSTYYNLRTFFMVQRPYYEPLNLAAATEPGNVYEDITPHSDSHKLLDEMKTVHTGERPRMKADQLKPKQSFPVAEKIGDTAQEHVYEDITPHSDYHIKLLDEFKKRHRMKADQLKPKQAWPVAEKIGDNTHENIYEDITPHSDKAQEYKPGIPKKIAINESCRSDFRKLPMSPPKVGRKGQSKKNITKPCEPTIESTGVLKENDTIDMDSRYDNMNIPRATGYLSGTESKITVAQKKGMVETGEAQVNVKTNERQQARKCPLTPPKTNITKKSKLSKITVAEEKVMVETSGEQVNVETNERQSFRQGPPTPPKTNITNQPELSKISVSQKNVMVETSGAKVNVETNERQSVREVPPTPPKTNITKQTKLSKITVAQNRKQMETGGAQINVETNEGRPAVANGPNPGIPYFPGPSVVSKHPILPPKKPENMNIPRGRIQAQVNVETNEGQPVRKGPPTPPKTNNTKQPELSKVTLAQNKVQMETGGAQVNVETNEGRPAVANGSNPGIPYFPGPSVVSKHPILPPKKPENMKISRGRIHPTSQATAKSIETESKITVAQNVDTSGEQVNVETNKGQSATTDGSNPNKGKSQLVPETIDVSQLTIAEVCDWMKRLKLEKYTEKFQEQTIDGAILAGLAGLDVTILKGELGMTAVEALILMKFAKDGHVPK